MSCTCAYRKRIAEARIPYVPERSVYLDYNATTPPAKETLAAFERGSRDVWANPGSLHSAGVRANERLEEARGAVARYFGRDSGSVSFCGSGTEAIHAGLSGWLKATGGGNIALITTRIEHASVYHPLRLCALAGKPVVFLPVDREGRVDPDTLIREASKRKRSLFVYSPVNHETGGIQPVRDIYRAARDSGCTVFIDGVQAAARLSPSVWSQYCDMFAVSSHKLYAPKGTGMLFSAERLKPFRFGGTQENGLFPGTENLPGIIALAAALELLASRQLEDEQVLSSLDTDGRRILDTGGFPYIWESPREKASGVFCISLPWVADMEELLFYLNTKHVFVSRFSACTGRVDGPSRVLCAMGRPFDRATRSLRVSLGRESTRKDLFTFGSVLKEYWSRARIHL